MPQGIDGMRHEAERSSAEQAILDRILTPAIASLPARDRQDALHQGRNQPLPATITLALS